MFDRSAGTFMSTALVMALVLLSLFPTAFGGGTPLGGEVVQGQDPAALSPDLSDHIGEEELFHLDFPTPELIQEGGSVAVRMEGYGQDPNPEALDVPRYTIPLKLPAGIVVDEIEILHPVTEIIPLPGRVARNPMAYPMTDLDLWSPVPDPYDPPVGHVEWSEGTGIDVETHETVCYLTVNVFPAVPVEGGLEVIRSGDLRVSYMRPPQPLFSEKSVYSDEGPYDLLVITREYFRNTFSDYLIYRNQTGIRTRLVTLEEISSDSFWHISENDTQEEIKRFIYNARLAWGIDYVLLGGDAEWIPARHIMVIDGYDDSGYTDGRFVPSDLYYSDLFKDGGFSTWNENTHPGAYEELYGEYNGGMRDGPDLFPDVFIGRLPATGTNEMYYMLDKIEKYEANALGSDWFFNATLCGTDTFTLAGHGEPSGIAEGEYISDLIDSDFLGDFNSTKHYQTQGTLSGISSTVNQGCGFLEMSDHGTYTNWGGAYFLNNARDQKNGYKLPLVVMDACLTHGFDNENASDPDTGKDPIWGFWYYPPGSTYSNRDSISEFFHKNPDGGGIATYGCTRVGFGNWGSNHPNANSGFMNYHLFKAYSEGKRTPGKMLAYAENKYLTTLGVGNYASYKTVTEYVLLGDPTVGIGGLTSTNVEPSFEEPSVLALPGVNRTVSFALNNTGLIPANVSLSAEFKGHSTMGWEVWLNEGFHIVPPFSNVSLSLNVTVPSSERYLEGRELEISARFMSKVRAASVIVQADRTWDVNVSADPTELSCSPGENVYGYFTVENFGNGPETFNTTVLYLQKEWTIRMGGESNEDPWFLTEVNGFRNSSVPFQIEVPLRTNSGVYDLLAAVTSNVTPANDSVLFRIEVEESLGLNLDPRTVSQDTLPGREVRFGINVTNTGNTPVAANLTLGDLYPRGWDIILPENGVPLFPFGWSSEEVRVRVPADARVNSYNINVVARTEGSEAECTLTVNVLPLHRFSVFTDALVKTFDISGSVSFQLNLSNLGNIQDDYRVEITSYPDMNWSRNISASSARVYPGQWRLIRLDLFSQSPRNGTYGFVVNVSSVSVGTTVSLPFTVIVPRTYDFSARASFLSQTVLPGEGMSGQLVVDNGANCEDVFFISAEGPPEWECSVSSGSIVLGPGEMSQLKLDIVSPEGSMAGVLDVLIHIRSKGSGRVVTITEMVTVDEIHNVTFLLTGGSGLMEVEAGETHAVEFTIRNLGNVIENLGIHLSTNGVTDEWRMLSNTSLRLEPNETAFTTLTVSVPVNATEGRYRVYVNITSDKGVGSSIRVDIQITEKDPGVLGISPTSIIATSIGLILVLVLIAGFWIAVRKRSGMDMSEAGLEWEE